MIQNCNFCKATFPTLTEDLEFYERVSPVIRGTKFALPPPNDCPSCRWQRRLAFRNERKLYRRKCDLTGRNIIAAFPEDTPFPVYAVTEWRSDAWDAMDYGRDFDFSRPFFEQFKELLYSVPQSSLFIDPLGDENSEFTNCASGSKNCYLISQAEFNRDCFYSRGINNCNDCCDCLRIDHSELCYEGINLSYCYNCLWCQDCDNCSDCYFSSGLRACKNCFGCHGLFQKEYYYFNTPLSKAEWTARVNGHVYTEQLIAELKASSEAIRIKTPQRYARVLQCENSSGDHIANCRESRDVFDSRGLEFCAYVNEVANGAKYCQDFSMWGINVELLYQCVSAGDNCYNMLFCFHSWQNVSNLIYCAYCGPSVKNAFGCAGVKRKEYCVFNKQYSKDDYETLVAKIIEHMQQTGEWGQFFPADLSVFGYNETIAAETFPLSEAEAARQGWNWRHARETLQAPKVAAVVPNSISATSDSICEQTLSCSVTGKPYKIIRQELALYRRLAVPVPTKHQEVRHRERVARRNPRKLWSRQCESCQKAVETSFAPDRPEIVYCEECYLAAVG